MANLGSLNLVIFVGHLSTDIKFKWVKARRKGKEKEVETALASFNLATNEAFGPKDKRVEFHRIVVWGKRAEQCDKYLRKGSFIQVVGKLRHRSFKGNDGRVQWITEVNADEITFLGKKGDYEDVPKEERPKPQNEAKKHPF